MPSKEFDEVFRMNQQLLTDLVSDPNATPVDFRRTYDDFLEQLAIPDGAEFESVEVGGVPGIWCTASNSSSERAVVHFHSGGYVIGSAHGYRQFGARLAAATGARVLLPDYSLAPENPFPAAYNEGLAIYRALRGEFDHENLIISGDSGGGGLALAVLQALRDAGNDLPAGGVLFSPWLDLTLTAESHSENKDKDPILNPDLLAALVQMYIGGTDVSADDPRVSPLFASFENLPPLLFLASSTECIRDDARSGHAKAREVGVSATYHEGEGMCHIWPIFADRLPEAREAVGMIGDFVKDRFSAKTAAS